MVPETPITSLGSAIFAFMASGEFASIEDAQAALCPAYRTVAPDQHDVAVYERLYPIYRDLYFAMGTPQSAPAAMGEVLPGIRAIAAEVRARHT
jgi:L-ribulokinase